MGTWGSPLLVLFCRSYPPIMGCGLLWPHFGSILFSCRILPRKQGYQWRSTHWGLTHVKQIIGAGGCRLPPAHANRYALSLFIHPASNIRLKAVFKHIKMQCFSWLVSTQNIHETSLFRPFICIYVTSSFFGHIEFWPKLQAKRLFLSYECLLNFVKQNTKYTNATYTIHLMI